MLETIMARWKALGAEEGRGRIVSIAKDGASIMNAAVSPLVTEFVIDRSSAVGMELFGKDGKGMLLFYDRCGGSPSEPFVDTVDDKHVIKRFREALGRSKGIKICEHSFDQNLLTRLLVEVGYEQIAVKNMFGDGEEDAQNVPAAVKLLLAISCFRSKTVGDFSADRRQTPIFSAQLAELKILSEYTGALYEVVTMQSADAPGTFLSLAHLNRSNSKLAHMAFVLFRQNLGSFVPPQRYYNTSIMLRTKYVSQASSKAEGIDNYFYYQDADDREEGLFGMVRTLERGMNFDMVQFEDRGSELMRLDDIYVRNPTWRKNLRRLSGPCFDHINPVAITGKGSDYSPVNLNMVVLPTCWLLGASDAKQVDAQSQLTPTYPTPTTAPHPAGAHH